MPLQDAINRLICGDEDINQGCECDGSGSSLLAELLQEILLELQGQPEYEGTVFVACRLPLTDPPARVLVEALYDEEAESWSYREAIGQGALTPGVDFDACPAPVDACTPMSAGFTADSVPDPIPPFNYFEIVAPPCCSVRVTTSAGSVIVPQVAGTAAIYNSPVYKCSLSEFEIEVEGCPPETVTVNLHNTGVV